MFAFTKELKTYRNRNTEMHALPSHLIYVTTHERKAPTNILFRSKAPKTHQVEHCQHPRKTSEFFSCDQPQKLCLFTKVPVQKMPLLYTHDIV